MKKNKSEIKIFIAHAKEDEEGALALDEKKAEELYNKLLEETYKPWMSKKSLLPGQDWRTAIPKAIQESDIFVALLSQESVKKQGYIHKEFKLALEAAENIPAGQIYIIPVRLNRCEVPDALSNFHWQDYWEQDWFERVTKAINTHLKEVDEYNDIIIQGLEKITGNGQFYYIFNNQAEQKGQILNNIKEKFKDSNKFILREVIVDKPSGIELKKWQFDTLINKLSELLDDDYNPKKQVMIIFDLTVIEKADQTKHRTNLLRLVQEIREKKITEKKYENVSLIMLDSPSNESSNNKPVTLGWKIALERLFKAEATPIIYLGIEEILNRENRNHESILQRIWYWSNGNLYLMQQICQLICSTSSRKFSEESDLYQFIILSIK